MLLGLINMMRGGSPNRSQKLMRLRVLQQFVAICRDHGDDLGDGPLVQEKRSGLTSSQGRAHILHFLLRLLAFFFLAAGNRAVAALAE